MKIKSLIGRMFAIKKKVGQSYGDLTVSRTGIHATRNADIMVKMGKID